MLSVGALGFLQPWFLAGLLALPLLWLLLRATPPRARRIAFPGVRVLLGLEDRERTPQRTPLWLLLLRMAAAALLLLAFAEPLLNPKARSASDGPLLLVMDGGWASAPDWAARRGAAEDALRQAAERDRPVAFVNLSAPGPTPEALRFEPADSALERVAASEPAPWRPDPARLLAAVEAAETLETVWIQDGLAGALSPEANEAASEPGAKAALAAALAAKGPLTMVEPAATARALARPEIKGGALAAQVLRAEAGAEETRLIAAFGGAGSGAARRVGAAEAAFGADDRSAEALIELPVQLRNTLERLQIEGARHAGAVALLDDRFQRRRVALVSGEQERRGLPLLSGLHYLRAALAPHAAAREASLRAAVGLPEEAVGAAAFGGGPTQAAAPLAGWADAIVLSDVGRIDPETETALTEWVREGGLLVRFAGPKLAALAIEREREIGRRRGVDAAPDPLLPVRLRGGGRALGGALSWSEPQALAPFAEESPFAGLATPPEVTVTRQVLAQPSAASTAVVWARLRDGTPLVTAREEGEGRVVLFHLTANAAWSSLPLSGLFVEMMGRMVAEAPALAGAFGDVSRAPDPAADATEDAARASPPAEPPAQAALVEEAAQPSDETAPLSAASAGLWRPARLLDGYGALQPADPAAAPIPGDRLAEAARNGARPGIAPGIYERREAQSGAEAGGDAARIAVNALGPEARLVAFEPPAGATRLTLSEREEVPLKPVLLASALILLLLDVLAALFIAGRLRPARGVAAMVIAGIAAAALTGAPSALRAQERAASEDEILIDPAARRAALESVVGYIVTGDARVDRVSRAGLSGLQQVLTERTALEPGAPAPVDLETDEIAVYAVLYWPITESQPSLSDAAVRRLNAFMRSGGLLVVDSRDAHQTFRGGEGPNAGHMRRLLSQLDLPPIAPIDRDHVLTRTFYIIDDAPGRWRGGVVWAAVGSGPADAADDGLDRLAGDVNDGVSPIVIGSVDWAGAWAVDARGQPMFPIGRGGERRREMARRFGVNLLMYAYTGNYKSDQVHIDALLERLDN